MIKYAEGIFVLMKLNEWYDYKLNETQQKLLNEDIEVYDLEAFIKQETEDLEEPFWFKKIAIFEGPRKNGCFVDYEAIGKFFGSPNDEVEIDTNDFDPEEPNVIYMRPTGSFKCSINDIINGAPVQVMKGKDFFTKATYNDRCYDNYCELVDFLDKIGYFEPRRLDAGLEEGLAVWVGPNDKFSDYHMETLPIDGETTPQMFKEILEENGYEVFDGITEAEFFKDDTLDWEPDKEHKYCWLVNGSMARWWVFKSFDSMLKWFTDGNTNHFGNCCSSKPINESLITESLNEGRYFDFQKKLEEKKKELRELINKLNACKTDEEKEQVLDSIDIVQNDIANLEGELAEIRYIDNGNASDYSGYESLEEEKEDKLETFEDKMNFLAKDEQEAIDGYDKVIALLDPEKDAVVIEQLNKIKVEEIAHKKYAEDVINNHDLIYTEPLEPEEDLEEGLETKVDEHGNKYLEFASEEEAKDYFDKNADKLPDGAVMHVNKIYFGKDGLEEDIEKHDTLNPVLFDGEELKPEVKEAIQKIVDTFIEELKEDEINFNLKDIVLLGSNVSYNYTKDSDLDVHLIVDSNSLQCPKELQDKLYGAYRSIFNKNYDINIKGIPVEIFVELDEPRAKSNGVYSLDNGWVKKPEQTAIPELDKEAFDSLFGEWEERYKKLIGE